ncbi:MAG: 50S ribosomal protein L18 [Patescibacteria group bacterium]|nr:50S ribosomal protein L18 [Patescibacteria group bacterium]
MKKNKLKQKRAVRIRAKIFGTASRPRLCIFRSLKDIYIQLVDDEKEKTIAALDSRKIKGGKNNIETAWKIGAEIAKIAKEKKIAKVVFDKHGYKYHGKVKALAEGAREGGLIF